MKTTPTTTPGQSSIVVRIEDVDVANRLVHAFDKSKARIQVSFRNIPGGGVLRIPAQGERWTAERQGWTWRLTGRISSADEHDAIVDLLQPGDLEISAPGTIYFDGQPFGTPVHDLFTIGSESTGPYGSPILDDFARADGPLGDSWLVYGTPTIVSEVVPFTDGGNGEIIWQLPIAPAAPAEAFVKFVTAPTGGVSDTEVGIMNRNDGYFAGYTAWYENSANLLNLARYDEADAYSPLGSVAFTMSDGDRLALTVGRSSAVITAWVDSGSGWLPILTATDSSPFLTAGPLYGLLQCLDDASIDSFGGGSYGSFVLSNDVANPLSVMPFLNGLLLDPTLWTLDGRTLSFVNDPAQGILVVHYEAILKGS